MPEAIWFVVAVLLLQQSANRKGRADGCSSRRQYRDYQMPLPYGAGGLGGGMPLETILTLLALRRSRPFGGLDYQNAALGNPLNPLGSSNPLMMDPNSLDPNNLLYALLLSPRMPLRSNPLVTYNNMPMREYSLNPNGGSYQQLLPLPPIPFPPGSIPFQGGPIPSNYPMPPLGSYPMPVASQRSNPPRVSVFTKHAKHGGPRVFSMIHEPLNVLNSVASGIGGYISNLFARPPTPIDPNAPAAIPNSETFAAARDDPRVLERLKELLAMNSTEQLQAVISNANQTNNETAQLLTAALIQQFSQLLRLFSSVGYVVTDDNDNSTESSQEELNATDVGQLALSPALVNVSLAEEFFELPNGTMTSLFFSSDDPLAEARADLKTLEEAMAKLSREPPTPLNRKVLAEAEVLRNQLQTYIEAKQATVTSNSREKEKEKEAEMRNSTSGEDNDEDPTEPDSDPISAERGTAKTTTRPARTTIKLQKPPPPHRHRQKTKRPRIIRPPDPSNRFEKPLGAGPKPLAPTTLPETVELSSLQPVRPLPQPPPPSQPEPTPNFQPDLQVVGIVPFQPQPSPPAGMLFASQPLGPPPPLRIASNRSPTSVAFDEMANQMLARDYLSNVMAQSPLVPSGQRPSRIIRHPDRSLLNGMLRRETQALAEILSAQLPQGSPNKRRIVPQSQSSQQAVAQQHNRRPNFIVGQLLSPNNLNGNNNVPDILSQQANNGAASHQPDSNGQSKERGHYSNKNSGKGRGFRILNAGSNGQRQSGAITHSNGVSFVNLSKLKQQQRDAVSSQNNGNRNKLNAHQHQSSSHKRSNN